jgi:hypothetical protein
MSALRDVERERGEGFDDLYREWQASAEAARTARERWKATVAAAVDADEDPPALPTEAETPEEPQRPRIIIGGSTIEKLALLLKANPRGLLCHRDEVSGLIGNFGQYNGAPGGDRAKWLEMWSAKTITVDRIKHPQPIVVDRPLVSLIGGIQPDRIASLLLKLGTDDDGFAARLLPFWPDPEPPRRPGRVPHREYLRRAMRRLSGLSGAPDGSPDVLRLTEHAAACMDDLRDRCFYAEASGKLKSAIGKFPGYAARLALVIQLARWAAGADGEPHPMEVDASSMEAAVGLIDSYFMPMAERLYGDASLPEEDRGAAVIARWITRHRVGRINARDLRRKRLPGLSESAPVRAAMASLVDAGWLRPDPSREGGTPGVPRSDYEVNPSLRVVS